MSVDEFWVVVERVHVASGGDMERKCELLAAELGRLPAVDAKAFNKRLVEFYYRAYRWDLWGAAYIMDDGCSDDSFTDFRYTLISMGREVYENALANPDSLAQVDISHPTYEGYQYVPTKVYEALTKQQGVSEQVLFEESEREWATAPRHPKEPIGTRFQEWAIESRYPKLAAKYGYKDSDHLVEKEFAERLAKKHDLARRVKTIMLESGIVPSCGLIPPPRVALQVLRTGRSPQSADRQCTWETFDFDEGHFWDALSQLAQVSCEELLSRPDLIGVKLTVDVNALGVETYEEWMQSLRERGLA